MQSGTEYNVEDYGKIEVFSVLGNVVLYSMDKNYVWEKCSRLKILKYESRYVTLKLINTYNVNKNTCKIICSNINLES